MIRLKTVEEIEQIQTAGEIVAGVLELVASRVEPGMTTEQLDRMAESFIRDHDGAEPAFKGLYGFPATLCTSLNEEVVHGIPSVSRRLAAGDLISVDVGVKRGGMFADAAVTVPVGDVGPEAERLLRVTRESLDRGVAEARPGARLGDVGAAIQQHVEDAGYSIVRELVGHGVGHEPHEEPHVPNFGQRGRGEVMDSGLVIAIEPMVNDGARHIRTLADGWTVVTADGSLSAHFEHTVAVTAGGPRVLTVRPATADLKEE
ncbi:MAG: type I methionyl aminopeptidase [Gemmatimonadetes bacterium]|nr:type I methionyl aminopeptidase [Gemmatimonadota bacterium]